MKIVESWPQVDGAVRYLLRDRHGKITVDVQDKEMTANAFFCGGLNAAGRFVVPGAWICCSCISPCVGQNDPHLLIDTATFMIT
ncbi:Uncharacterised protein [uncultured archaeon]|nr:Uncharacterised protein [uncultured archaeon]